ncbi:MAG: FAD-dependent oxidoreductase [Clostridia bacterium]|nr:FAD-dependent oxidoreductase [Clostridia bacterium]
MQTIEMKKSVPVVGAYDVVICGGGPAGFIAAIAAAREGAKTALIEQYGFLGGMATAGLVAPISVFSYNNALVIGGIPWEFIKRLEEMGGALIEQPLHNIAFDPELYKLCAQRMVIEAGVDLYMHSYLTGCVRKDGRITHVTIENKNGAEAIEGKVFIDCTGDADLANMAEVPMQPMNGEPLQPLSYYFCLDGVDTDSELLQCMHHNRQGVNCHCEPVRAKMLELSKIMEMPTFGGPWFCTLLRDGCVTVNTTRTPGNACDNRNFTTAECKLREDIFTLAKILRDNFEEFKNCRVSYAATQAGVRETRRIVGLHTITAQEYLTAYEYEDSISRGCHPIDIHSNNVYEQSVHFLEKPAYVPYRALVPVNQKNLLVAGRCLSADRQAFASLRVQASAMGAGQAAGVAAAMSAQQAIEVKDVNVAALRDNLRQKGTVI